MNLERLIQGKLLAHGFSQIDFAAQKAGKHQSIILQFEARKKDRYLSNALKSLNYYAKKSIIQKKLHTFASYHHSALLLSKSMIGLSSYSRYRQQKKLEDSYTTSRIELVILKSGLKKWKKRAVFFAKIYHIRDLVSRLFRRQFFKRYQDSKALKI